MTENIAPWTLHPTADPSRLALYTGNFRCLQKVKHRNHSLSFFQPLIWSITVAFVLQMLPRNYYHYYYILLNTGRPLTLWSAWNRFPNMRFISRYKKLILLYPHLSKSRKLWLGCWEAIIANMATPNWRKFTFNPPTAFILSRINVEFFQISLC